MKRRRFFVFAFGCALTCGLAQGAQNGSPSYAVTPRFQWLRLGEVKPSGWIKAQMLRNLRQGALGHLDQLAPEARSDIFASGRNAPGRPNAAKEGFEQGAWWNGETEGNWHRGYIMTAYLTGDVEAMEKSSAYVQHILDSQDNDGYIGVYSPELRYSKSHVNGELWTETCILRALLAYYELTGRPDVLRAVERAVKLTVENFGPGKMTAFPNPHYPGDGISHGLMFIDVLERLYQLTGDKTYRDFGVWLYHDYCASAPQDGHDGTVASLLDLDKPLRDHGPTTIEHLRVPLWVYYVTGDPQFGRAYENGLTKLGRYMYPSGAIVAMEDIGGRRPDPTTTYYEFCSMKELLSTYCSALQKTGRTDYGDEIEKLMFNAIEGAGLATGKGVTYCTRDNRYRIDGSLKGRDKFSPTHMDVAVCCNPNSSQVTPLYLEAMWMRSDAGLAAMLYGPAVLDTTVNGVPVEIEERTDYPFSFAITFVVNPARACDFALRLRNPGWSKGTRITCEGATVSREDSSFVLRKEWRRGDQIRLEFSGGITATKAANGEIALARGPLVYALGIPGTAKNIRDYDLPGFADEEYFPAQGAMWSYALDPSAADHSFGFNAISEENTNSFYPYDASPIRLEGRLINLDTGKEENVQLVPMASRQAILRRVTFPAERP